MALGTPSDYLVYLRLRSEIHKSMDFCSDIYCYCTSISVDRLSLTLQLQ